MGNLPQMDKFLGRHNLIILNQEEIENINRPITHNEVENCGLKSSSNKSPGPDCFSGELNQKFREELIPILLKLFQKIAKGGTLPRSC